MYHRELEGYCAPVQGPTFTVDTTVCWRWKTVPMSTTPSTSGRVIPGEEGGSEGKSYWQTVHWIERISIDGLRESGGQVIAQKYRLAFVQWKYGRCLCERAVFGACQPRLHRPLEIRFVMWRARNFNLDWRPELRYRQNQRTLTLVTRGASRASKRGRSDRHRWPWVIINQESSLQWTGQSRSKFETWRAHITRCPPSVPPTSQTALAKSLHLLSLEFLKVKGQYCWSTWPNWGKFGQLCQCWYRCYYSPECEFSI